MSRFAEATTVTSTKSREEIERTLTRYGADQFMYGWRDQSAVIGFRADGRMIRFLLPLPAVNDPSFTTFRRGYSNVRRTEAQIAAKIDAETRRRWRALLLIIKAKLEAVESGITVFEDEFMANIVLPDNQTVSDWMRPQIADVYQSGRMPEGLPMLTGPAK